MGQQDLLHRFIFENLGVRGELVQLSASWRALYQNHPYPQTLLSLLGEASAAVVLLASVIKFRGALILQIQGKGPVRTLVTQATDQKTVRGLARWEGEIESANFLELFDQGHMVLTTEAPSGKRYQGIVGLEGSCLETTLEGYFQQSEQLPTRFWLAADKNHAAGLMLQELPGKNLTEEDWLRLTLLSDTLKEDELLTLPSREILHRLYHEEDIRLFDPEPIAYRCDCSVDRIRTALRSLPRADLEEILAESGEIKVDCEFCGRNYRFDAVDLGQALSSADTHATPRRTQ